VPLPGAGADQAEQEERSRQQDVLQQDLVHTQAEQAERGRQQGVFAQEPAQTQAEQAERSRQQGVFAQEPVQTRRTLLADGCTHVYLDVGSNIGVQVRKLYQPGEYVNAKVLPVFDVWFGPPEFRAQPSERTGLCAFGFEANPLHAERLRGLEAAYQKQGWRVHFFAPVAVTAKSEGNVTFHLGGAQDNHYWGGNVNVRAKKNTGGSGDFTVPTFSLADFIETHINPRALGPHALLSKPAVVMKMDIEGSEYSVLREMTRRHLMCADVISAALLEWHQPKWARGETWASTAAVKSSVQEGAGCPQPRLGSKLVDIDDESYYLDGVPLPR